MTFILSITSKIALMFLLVELMTKKNILLSFLLILMFLDVRRNVFNKINVNNWWLVEVWKRFHILYINSRSASVRDTTVPRFNPPAEPARTVGFGKRDSARTVGFEERDSKTRFGPDSQIRKTGFGPDSRTRGTGFQNGIRLGQSDSENGIWKNGIPKIHVIRAPSRSFLFVLCSCNSRASNPSTHSRTCTWAHVQQPQFNIVYSSCALKS